MTLMVSQLIIKIAGLFYKIYLTNKYGFGDTGNAIFSAGFQIYTIFLAISSIGVPNAISGLISAKTAVGDNRGAYRIFKIAISIFGLIGFLGTSILFFNAKKISNTYLGIPEAELTIMALSPSVFIVAILSVLRGYFNGREKISVTAHSQSIEQILKTVFTVIIVEIFGYITQRNTVIMVAGAAFATTLATIISFIYLYIYYIRSKKDIWKDVITSTIKQKESVNKIIKSILLVSFPIMLASLLATSNRTIDAFTVVNTISKFIGVEKAKLQYGILTGKVEGLVMLPYSFNITFATTLIPTISASEARGEMDKAMKKIDFSILATILISLPCIAIFFTFPQQILKLLFPNAYLGASMLKICSLSIVFVTITQTIGGILQGLKRVKEPLIAIGIGSIVKLVLNLVLVPIKSLNINGAIIASLVSHIIVFSISYYYLKKYLSYRIKIIKFIIKPILATIAMMLTSLLIYNLRIFNLQNINLIFALLVGAIVYVMLIVLLKIL